MSAIAKVTRVVEVFMHSRCTTLPFHEIRDGAGLQAATAHRLLADLVEHGWLTQKGTREEYSLGPVILGVSVLTPNGLGHRTLAEPHIQDLRDLCGETVTVTELHGGYVVPVLRADGLFEMRMNQQVGARYPAYAGATGKLLLAYSDPEDLDRYLSATKLEPLTGRTIVDRDVLRREFEVIRRLGIAVSRGERVEDAIAISAPLRDRTGIVRAAVTVSGVAYRFGFDELMSTAAATKACAETISLELGWRRTPGHDGLPESAGRLLAEMCAAAAFEGAAAARSVGASRQSD